MLLENGADPNATDKLESTPLHRASAKGNYRLIQLLLRESASTNIQDSQGNTPLYVKVFVSYSSGAVLWFIQTENRFSHLCHWQKKNLLICHHLTSVSHMDVYSWYFSQANWPHSGWGYLSPLGKLGYDVHLTPRWKHFCSWPTSGMMLWHLYIQEHVNKNVLVSLPLFKKTNLYIHTNFSVKVKFNHAARFG